MALKVVFREAAKIGVRESKAYYKSQRAGLEKLFAASIKEGIARIQRNPEAFAIRYRNIRIAHPYKFPFSIRFYIDESAGMIVITNISHDYMDIK